MIDRAIRGQQAVRTDHQRLIETSAGWIRRSQLPTGYRQLRHRSSAAPDHASHPKLTATVQMAKDNSQGFKWCESGSAIA